MSDTSTTTIKSLDLDINTKKEEKRKEREEYIDKFNFWIYVGFIVLGILFILTLILLIYSIFFSSSNPKPEKIVETKIITSPTISKLNNEINHINDVKKSSNSMFSSLFKSSPKSIENNLSSSSSPSSSSSSLNPIENKPSIMNSSSSTSLKPIENNNKTSFFSSLFKKKDNITNNSAPAPIKPVENNKPSFFSSLFKKKETSNTLPKLSTSTENTSLSSIVKPLFNRKIERPNIDTKGGCSKIYKKNLKFKY